MKKITYFLLLAVLAGFSSCSKDDSDDASTPTPSAPTPNTVPAIGDADGVFAAVYTNNWVDVPFVGVMNLPIGTAVAVVASTTGGSTYVDAGVVKCEDSTLTKNSSNNYYFQPALTNPYGLALGGSVAWSVSGSASVTALNYTTSNSFPDVDSIANGKTIDKSVAYTLQASGSVTNSDSVIFVVAGPSATLMATRPAGTSSHTFSATEMATIGAGTGIIEIVPYNIESTTTVGGKKYYFINETAVTKMVTIN